MCLIHVWLEYVCKTIKQYEFLISIHVNMFKVDNLVLMTGEGGFPQRNFLATFMEKYRRVVNPNLLYVNISFAGKSAG